MLHSPNSFLIHDVSVGTIGASKQPLKTKTTTTMRAGRGGGRQVQNVVSSVPREWAFGKPLSREDLLSLMAELPLPRLSLELKLDLRVFVIKT